jgi:hypothetical protein
MYIVFKNHVKISLSKIKGVKMSCGNKENSQFCDKECASKNYDVEDSYAPVHIDIERMEKALKSETIVMPQGLNREEKRQFILEQAAKHMQGN